jgi:hypothetical protein
MITIMSIPIACPCVIKRLQNIGPQPTRPSRPFSTQLQHRITLQDKDIKYLVAIVRHLGVKTLVKRNDLYVLGLTRHGNRLSPY